MVPPPSRMIVVVSPPKPGDPQATTDPSARSAANAELLRTS